MREDWVFVDFARTFMPSWLAKLTSFRVFSLVTLALIIIVVALKVGTSIA